MLQTLLYIYQSEKKVGAVASGVLRVKKLSRRVGSSSMKMIKPFY